MGATLERTTCPLSIHPYASRYFRHWRYDHKQGRWGLCFQSLQSSGLMEAIHTTWTLPFSFTFFFIGKPRNSTQDAKSCKVMWWVETGCQFPLCHLILEWLCQVIYASLALIISALKNETNNSHTICLPAAENCGEVQKRIMNFLCSIVKHSSTNTKQF